MSSSHGRGRGYGAREMRCQLYVLVWAVCFAFSLRKGECMEFLGAGKEYGTSHLALLWLKTGGAVEVR